MSADPDRTLDFRPAPAEQPRGALAPAPPEAHAEATADVARGAETVGMKPFLPPTPPPDPALATLQAGPVDEQRQAEWSTPSPVHPFPGFRLVEEVGRGAVGVVYKARQAAPDRTVALKVLLEGTPDERALERFKREAKAVAGLSHGHVVPVYEYGEAAGKPYLVMEFCPGGTLTERLAAAPAGLQPDAAAALIRKLALGVAAAHAVGIVHRDLKPGNVLFDEAGEPKVSDFGLAKVDAASQLTVAGDIMGTPAYMAPEQAAGEAKRAGPQADVWSLGVMLYECLTGFRPFTGRNNIAVLAAVQAADPDPVRKLAPRVDPDLARVCHRCLEKDPKDRYADAGQLASALSLVLAGVPLPAGRSARRWWLRAAGVGLLVAGLSAAGWWLSRPSQDPPPSSGTQPPSAQPENGEHPHGAGCGG